MRIPYDDDAGAFIDYCNHRIEHHRKWMRLDEAMLVGCVSSIIRFPPNDVRFHFNLLRNPVWGKRKIKLR